jgi:hypothetical protein
MSEWQSIDTAPKDGSAFIAYFDGQPFIAHYDDERYANKPRPHFSPRGNVFGRAWARDNQPKYWMPIPPEQTS